ncbi:hypothetical protein [Magnetospirillum aberrantis]|uniref:Uncharacterized protein n=1 Tax=Magnetospirillum aberrantis SpK TaxID=908842 RepID=A0A7C9QTL7_9PROT|nr:hypothetical protein [Magnetospirillum aberrantis]NFV79997.1 hypothetical protein [Magnetospirillum aberrantis SpK]
MGITYARVDGPPVNWRGCRVFDCDTGAEVKDVLEVNAAEGWLIRYVRDAGGQFVMTPDGQDILSERIEGRFRIVPPPT